MRCYRPGGRGEGGDDAWGAYDRMMEEGGSLLDEQNSKFMENIQALLAKNPSTAPDLVVRPRPSPPPSRGLPSRVPTGWAALLVPYFRRVTAVPPRWTSSRELTLRSGPS